MARPFFTIGHSTRSIDEFMDLLSNAEVQLVVDVRTIPRSRTNPQYNSEALAKALSKSGIDYEHIAALGGLRGRKRDVPADVNAFWQNRSFHNYADYAMSEEFHSGLSQAARIGARHAVRDHVRGGRVVAMSSADHRRLSDRRRRDGIPHSRAESSRAGTHDGRSQARAGWNADLSSRCLKRCSHGSTVGLSFQARPAMDRSMDGDQMKSVPAR